MSDEREVLSSLIDREPVDPDVLARVLEDPDNRRLLVQFVRLRALAQHEEAGEIAPGPSILPRAAQRWGDGWMRAAAMFVLLATAAGGGMWIEKFVSRERPPEPTRVVQLEPAPSRR